MTKNILSYDGKTPSISDHVWIAHNATVAGNVVIGSKSSVWFQAVIRGDANGIIIGNKVNIQDGAVVHGSTDKQDTIIGDNITIGHRAIVHGCTIQNNVLIGMGAIILDDVLIMDNVIVGAGAVVTQGSVLESGFLYAGVPAKKIKPLQANSLQMIQMSAEAYVQYAKKYQNEQF